MLNIVGESPRERLCAHVARRDRVEPADRQQVLVVRQEARDERVRAAHGRPRRAQDRRDRDARAHE